jgi:DGQHR domain-containing protein
MQFAYLSGTGGAKLWLDAKNESGPKSQIDVVGIEDELGLSVECKSQDKFAKRPQFQEELSKLAHVRERFSKAINANPFTSGRKRQAVLVLFLSNIELTKNDRERAEEANVQVFDERDLDYYEKLVAHLGPAAKYQFFADLLPGKSVAGLEIRVPSVRTRMGAHNSYSFPISPEYLLKISYVSHRSKGKASDVHTYQRMLSKTRLTKIRQYISEAGIFPTNIVVNLDKRRLIFERIKQDNPKEDQEESGVLGWLTIKPAYKSAWIIDGQHRLFAYSGHPRAKTGRLGVLAFEGLPPSRQAQLFIDINAKQKSVKQSLLQELFAELHWDAAKPRERVQAIVSKAIQVLDADKFCPLYSRIQTADATKDSRRCISLTSVFGAVESKDFYIVREKKDTVTEYGPLWAATDMDDTLDRTVYVLKHWLLSITTHCAAWWDLGSADGGGLAMNDGVISCINVLRSVFTHFEARGVKLIHYDNADLVELIKPYGEALGKHFGHMTAEERKGFRDLRGIQGQTARTRRCQQAIRLVIPDFNPPGLDEFIKREKEQTNLRAKLITDHIELMLKTVVVEELRREYSTGDDWWVLGVPKQVRLAAMAKHEEDDGKRGSREAYFDLISYRKIALEKWDLFGPLLGYGSTGNKEKKTKWLITVNEKRNLVAHPTSGVSLSVEELAELESYESWLKSSIAGTVQPISAQPGESDEEEIEARVSAT